MNSYHDSELDDVLQDSELRRVASLLHTARTPEPPLDDAFRTGLRRQLMQEAWSMTEGRASWWRRAFAPPGIAWAGALAGVLLIAAVAVWTSSQQNGSTQEIIVASTLDNKNNVGLQSPILVAFNQPMDHQSTENAVQIRPATSVTFAWDSQSRQLAVTPVAGNLAPNTQYQVTIGSGAKTASNQQLAAPQTITFVTQPPAASPSPTPRPTPANPLSEKQIAPLNGAAGLAAQWSGDSASIYFIDGKGSLRVIAPKGGAATTIAPDGATALAVSPAGDRLAYLRGGKIEVLTFAAGKTDELAPTPTPTLVGWAKDQLLWAAGDGVYGQTSGGIVRLALLPRTGAASVLSIAPDGTHAAYAQGQSLFVLDLSSGKSAQLGQAGDNDTFLGWSPDGTQLLYATTDRILVADVQGATQSTLPTGQASWSSQDAILLGGDTTLFEVHPDGANLTRLSNGTYRTPVWAPDGSSFAFVRSDSLWVATAPALPPEPTVVDEATAVVKKFMDARLNGKSDEATALLDDSGKKAYGAGGLNLMITGDPHFSRYYILTEDAIGAQPDTARFVVRLVLSHGKKDVSESEEALILVRDASSKQFLIDQATGGAQRDLGKGPEVVSVAVGASAIQVTFDSDLDPGTVNGGVLVLDRKGNQVDATVAYANRTVTVSGLDLKEGTQYRLVVLSTVRDVEGHNVAAEYDLNIFGPAVQKHTNHRPVSASPSPATTPSAAAG
ncbi:MAG TPA: Ig-like domain-containing protein [Candidatus Limnocylindrales bacterium]|nr:Ig-like domain-containing protein [Candidatus Limnocylindrales bacterium]